MKAWKPEDKDEKPDLTPIIDIIFLLIVFFMVVGAILTQEKIQMDLAVADEAAVPQEASGRLLLNVLADGSLFAGMQPIEYSDIPAMIEFTRGTRPDMKVYLRADRNTPYRFIRDVLKECAAAGQPDVIFGVTQVEVGGN